MGIDIRVMTLDDLNFGMALKEKAGWNQTPADWKRFLELQPDGCFIAALDGQNVGCGTTCILGAAGWIAMILVDPAARGKGVGTQIMRRALAFLAENHVATPRLDATADGRPVYEKLGFLAEYKLTRMAGTLKPPRSAPAVRQAAAQNLPDLAALDFRVTGTDRSRLLHRLLAEFPETFLLAETEGGEIAGYATWRPGTRASQIGPCCALNPEAGEALLGEAARRLAGQNVIMDIPQGNERALAWARARGLSPQREYLRMRKGPEIVDRVDGIWASSGPEKG